MAFRSPVVAFRIYLSPLYLLLFFTWVCWRTLTIWPAELPTVWMLWKAHPLCSSTCSSVLRTPCTLAARFRTGSRDSWIWLWCLWEDRGWNCFHSSKRHIHVWLSLCSVNNSCCLMPRSIYLVGLEKWWCFNTNITFQLLVGMLL